MVRSWVIASWCLITLDSMHIAWEISFLLSPWCCYHRPLPRLSIRAATYHRRRMPSLEICWPTIMSSSTSRPRWSLPAGRYSFNSIGPTQRKSMSLLTLLGPVCRWRLGWGRSSSTTPSCPGATTATWLLWATRATWRERVCLICRLQLWAEHSNNS